MGELENEVIRKEMRNIDWEKIKKQKFADEEMEEILEEADRIGEWFRDKSDNREMKISETKFRKFFDDVKRVQRKLDAGISFAELKPQILLMKSKAAYETARGIPEKFRDFFVGCIDNVLRGDEKTYKNFVTFFEAVYAYFYYHSKSKGERGQ